MEEIKKFIAKELFQNTQSDIPLHERVKSLIDAFRDNKQILVILHEYVVNTLTPSNQAVSDTLKREWFKLWGKNTIVQEDIPVIKHYFNFYTPKEQRVLMEKIELEAQTTLDSESIKDLQLKKMSEVDLALYYYKKDQIEPLKNYVENLTSLTKTELDKILEKIFGNNDSLYKADIKKGSLPILVTLYRKTKPQYKKWIERGLNTTYVLMHSKEEIKEYEDILEKYYSIKCANYGREDRTSENIKNEFVLSHLVRISFDSYFDTTSIQFYDSIKDLDNSTILHVLENADKYLKKYDFANEKAKKDNKINGKGISIVFNSLNDFAKRINNPDFSNSIANIENLYKTHKEQKALRRELTSTLDSNFAAKPKLKV